MAVPLVGSEKPHQSYTHTKYFRGKDKMSAEEYLKQIDNEWNALAFKNANGRLLTKDDLSRFLELKEKRKRLGKSWQK